MSLKFDPERVWMNVRKATTEDLLDRVTAYRAGLEPEALAIIEEELGNRGVDRQAIQQRAESQERETIRYADGTAVRCAKCRKPAVMRIWGWQKVFRVLPLFPRRTYLCEEHGQ